MLLSDWAGPQQHFFLFGWQIKHPCAAKRSITAYLRDSNRQSKIIHGLSSPSQVFWPKTEKVPKNCAFASSTPFMVTFESLVYFFILAGVRVVFRFTISSRGWDSFPSAPYKYDQISVVKCQTLPSFRAVQDLKQGVLRAEIWRITSWMVDDATLKSNSTSSLSQQEEGKESVVEPWKLSAPQHSWL